MISMECHVRSSAMLCRNLHVAVVATSWLLVVGGSTTFFFFYIMTLTRWFNVNATEFIAWRNGLVLQYYFANATTGKTTPLLSSTYSFILIWQWAGTLAAALGAAGLLWTHHSNDTNRLLPPAAAHAPAHQPTRIFETSSWSSADVSPGAAGKDGAKASKPRRRSLGVRLARAVARVRRLLRWQVPPRGLWRALLGPDGLSMLDLLLVLIWLGLHVLWLTDMTLKVLDARRAPPSAAASSAAATKVVTTAAAAVAGNATTRIGAAANSTSANSTACANATSANGAAVTAARNNVRLRSLLAANSSSGSSGSKATTTTATTTAKTTTTAKSLPREVQNSLAKYTGAVGNLDLLLLFFPLPRCNFLHWVLGTDFPALVKYHRWLGHATLLLYSLHGIIYMALWTKDGTMSANMQWSMGGYVNNVAGLISLVAGWVLWITSVPFIRRRLFNLFYTAHIGGTVVFMLFALMHRKDIAPWIMPGIFLYLLDVVLRTIQQAFNVTRVSAVPGANTAAVASLSPHGSVLTLTIQCDKVLSWAGLDIVFLNVPEVSWWQWHPFTLANSSVAGGPETKMVLHIKTYNRWTQRLVSRLAANPEPIKLYVSGPYYGAHRHWITSFDRHVFVAGGIGVTPVFAMLKDLMARRRAMAAAATAASASDETVAAAATEAGSGSGATAAVSPPGRVCLVWISRSRDELGTLPVDILHEATKTGSEAWLDLKLYLTADEDNDEEGNKQEEEREVQDKADGEQQQQKRPQQPSAALQHSSPRSSPLPSSRSSNGDGSKGRQAAATSLTIPVHCLTSADADEPQSAKTHGTVQPSRDSAGINQAHIARPLAHPYMFSPLLWAAAVTLCFGGGFAGFVCAQAYDAHISRTVAVRNDYTHVGLLQFAALGVGSTLPPALLMLAVHLYWAIKSRRSARASFYQQQQQHYSDLYDTPVSAIATAAAATSRDSCRAASSLHALHTLRLSVTSTATSATDDETSGQNAVADKSVKSAPRAPRFRGSFGSVEDYNRYTCLADAEPYIVYGKPDLSALLENVSRTGGGPAAATAGVPPPAPAAQQQQPPLSAAVQQLEGATAVTCDPPSLAAAEQIQKRLDPDTDPSDLRVAVFVAGPARLVAAVEEGCARLNGPWGRRGRCYLESHPLTHEL